MRSFVLLSLALIFLLVITKWLAKVGVNKPSSSMNEIKQNCMLLVLGMLLCMIILFIPYQVWILMGSSHAWDAVYIIGSSALATIGFSFYYYNRSAKRILNKE